MELTFTEPRQTGRWPTLACVLKTKVVTRDTGVSNAACSPSRSSRTWPSSAGEQVFLRTKYGVSAVWSVAGECKCDPGPFRILTMRRLVRDPLTLADAGEQQFSPLCANDVRQTLKAARAAEPGRITYPASPC